MDFPGRGRLWKIFPPRRTSTLVHTCSVASNRCYVQNLHNERQMLFMRVSMVTTTHRVLPCGGVRNSSALHGWPRKARSCASGQEFNTSDFPRARPLTVNPAAGCRLHGPSIPTVGANLGASIAMPGTHTNIWNCTTVVI